MASLFSFQLFNPSSSSFFFSFFLLSSLISLGLEHDAHQAEVNAAAGEVLRSLGESAQQSWL